MKMCPTIIERQALTLEKSGRRFIEDPPDAV
jgi:hypothetical protein